MTSSIINWIVDKYLSNILEINKEQTKSSIWSGVVEMSNLKIKPDIFTSLNLIIRIIWINKIRIIRPI